MCALQQAFVLQIRDVLMDGGQRTEAQTTGYFLVRGRVAVFLREAGEKVDDLFLPPSDSHAEIVANKKRIARPLLILSIATGESKWQKGIIPILKLAYAKKCMEVL